jgi:hypothetical protein
MSHLEEMWNCELETYEAVERLAQCLALRNQTWQRLKELREQVGVVLCCVVLCCVVLCCVVLCCVVLHCGVQ